jgi:hypothetical protein
VIKFPMYCELGQKLCMEGRRGTSQIWRPRVPTLVALYPKSGLGVEPLIYAEKRWARDVKVVGWWPRGDGVGLSNGKAATA